MRKSAFVSLIVLGLSTLSSAQTKSNQVEICSGGNISNAAYYDCLSKQFHTFDSKLNTVNSSMIKNLPQSGLWGDFESKASEKRFYKRREQEILNAHKHWVEFSKAECKLAAGVYGGGSGQSTAEILCRINKTSERLNYLKTEEPYKSFHKTKE